jgi:hypothetical protein
LTRFRGKRGDFGPNLASAIFGFEAERGSETFDFARFLARIEPVLVHFAPFLAKCHLPAIGGGNSEIDWGLGLLLNANPSFNTNLFGPSNSTKVHLWT